MKIFSGRSNEPLAEKIAHFLGTKLSPLEIFIFPDGERRIRLEDTVVDEDVVIVQSTSPPVDQRYIELFFMADAASRSGARSITVVMPYMGYQRQDHVFREGEAVSLQVFIRMLEVLGVDTIITFDLHSIKIPEFFHIPLVHLSALPLYADIIQKNDWNTADSFLVSPDMGGLRRIKKMSELLDGMPWIAMVKDRDLTTGKIEIKSIEGDKANIRKRAIIVDDMISSGGTIVKSSEFLRQYGVEEMYVFITQSIFSKQAPRLLQESVINKIFVTDSVFISEEKTFDKLEIISIAKMIAENLNKR